MLLETLPASLTELAILEEVEDGFSLLYRTRYAEQVFRPSLGLSMARASRQLQHFSTSFAIDAKYFLQPFWPEASNVSTDISDEWSWSRLETLALTSKLLASPKQSVEDVNYLLEATSLAVRRMPKLLTMEIWCGNGMEHACLFRYSYDSDSRTASLTWKGTWTVDITERTARSWRETVRQRTGVGAEIQVERLAFRAPLMTEAVALYLDLGDRAATTRVSRFLSMLLLFVDADPNSRHHQSRICGYNHRLKGHERRHREEKKLCGSECQPKVVRYYQADSYQPQ